jgi:pSer/pThr/pTyr-binding forkhead associated (FHA) protein
VNGKKVQEAYLKDGDVLTLSEGGPKVSFLTQIREEPYEADSKQAPQILEEPYKEPQPVAEEKPLEPKRVVTQSARISVQPVQVPLTIQYGPTIRSFRELPVILGKSPKCNFMIEHPAIFDQHAQIFFIEDQYWIKDLTGQNLLRINSQLIALQTPLKQEDEIALSPQGPVFRFLGGGRLAEIAEPQIEQKAPSYKKEEAPRHEIPEEKPQKGVLSKFKKLWKSS